VHLGKLFNWRSALIYLHRWSGLTLTLVFVVWFISGIVFVYVGMPALPAEERLLRMQPLDVSTLAVAPAQAAARAGLSNPGRVRLAMSNGRPVYRLQAEGDWRMVYGDTGEVLTTLNREQALEILRRFLPDHASQLTYEGRLTDSDQWTLQAVIRDNMPLHRIAVNDAAGTEYYVSEKTGEPVLETTARGRFWGYMSAVLHWLYFTPLRRHTVFWTNFVIWASMIGAVMCGFGIAIGIWRFSASRRFRLKGQPSYSPYATWMKWHHYVGLVFGLFACTWAFSGALSLGPFRALRGAPTTRAYREAATGGPINLAPLTVDRIRSVVATVRGRFTPREIDFFQFGGEPYFVAYQPPAAGEHAPWANVSVSSATSLIIERPYVMVSALRPEAGTFTGFPRERMWDVAKAAMPGVGVEDAVWLEDYDNYYYSQDGRKTLPVLRIRYADARRTWLYLDPQHGVIASRLDRGSRMNRWLYKGLHDLDFPFLYYRRPLWDIVIVILSLGGIAVSVTSALPAWRRLARHARRVTHASRPAPALTGALTPDSESLP
jgi:hypothetical protein